MALQKQPININFAQGLDQKTDPFQVEVGKFLSLTNSVFGKGGMLQKRNGYGSLTALPDNTTTNLTTFNGNLTAIGNKLQAYDFPNNTWVNKGHIQPVQLDTLPIIRSNTNQSQADSVVSPNGLVCTVFTDNVPVTGTNQPMYKYVIADAVTGQNIIPPTLIPGGSGTVTGSPRVFLLSNYFIIMFTNVISAVNHLQYIPISSITPTIVGATGNISSVYTPSTTVNFDAFVANGNLYVAWNGSDTSVKMTFINAGLVQANTVSFSGQVATLMSVTADLTPGNPVIYASYFDSASHTGHTFAVTSQLNTVHAPVLTIPSGTVLNITSVAQNGICTFYYEVANNYSYDSSIPTHFIEQNTVTQSGTVGTATNLRRSVGLASKAFLIDGVIYVLSIYYSVFQPSYFLIDQYGNVVCRLAYSNGGVYYTLGLPNVTVNGYVGQIAYFYKDTIAAVNKTQGAASAAGVYSQTGINLATFGVGTTSMITAEIGGDLQLSGGMLWMYDGFTPVENNFQVWPDNVEVTTATTGGFLADQTYFYQVTYEWSDNQGNVFRSAPSIPVEQVTAGGGTSANTINVPTLRLTYKIANPVKIVIYRWSTAEQIYYQVTSVLTPLLNDVTVDSVSFVDTQSDASIIGNNIIYTTGGVVEDIAGPASDTITLFQSRLFLVDSEDKNLLWYSKQVIENTPVEMSDLFTLYIAPTTGAQGSTGPITALSALDDKLIIFKKDAIYYINGTGPDNTGANSQFSEPTFITATVGCANQQSIVFMPQGLMFQSDKGIWLLGRDLSTNYIGAPVETSTQTAIVQSAVNVPGTNQVRFTLDSGVTLMYDYYYGQWGSFANVPAISSTLYQGLHTYVNDLGLVFQETPGKYIDGANPVLMSFTTSWLNLAGLRGYERAYFFYLLGVYISPHKLSLQIAYDYELSPSQTSVITPDNYAKPWGGDSPWGGSPTWGGEGNVEQWRIFLSRGKCRAFQITLNEIFDPSFNTAPGAGLTLSGLNVIAAIKKGYAPLKASRQVG